jgi:hypothetical protein
VWLVYVFVAVLEIADIKRHELRNLVDTGGFFAAKMLFRSQDNVPSDQFMAVHVILPAD